MLQAIDLTKRYDDGSLALDALNLQIEEGEIFFLLGANGAGKTTTLNLFLNFIRPTSGQALIDGRDSVRQSLEAKRFISYISENVMLYEDLSARENLEFFARLNGKNPPKETYYNLMRIVGLKETDFEKRVKYFSKGMRQKVGLACVLQKDTPNILMDEPTTGLDPKSAAELMDTLLLLKQKGKSILLCTHDLFRARMIADRIGIMKEGRMVMLRPREEFIHEDIERIYLDYMQEVPL